MADNKAFRRVPTGADAASRLQLYNNPTHGRPRYKARRWHQSLESGVSPLNRPASENKDSSPPPPRAKKKWYSPHYKDKYLALPTGRGVSPLNRPTHKRVYDPRPPAAKTRWYSPQYKDSTKNRYRRYSPGNCQRFNNVSPLNRPATDTTQIPHPRPNSKPGKVSTAAVFSASPPDFSPPRTQGEITKVWQVERGDFLHYRCCSSGDEGYASASDSEDSSPLLFPVPRRGRRRRGRDRRVVEVHLVTSLARLSLKSTSDVQLAVATVQDTHNRKRVICADSEPEAELVLPRKRKREDPLFTGCHKQQKICIQSLDDVYREKMPKDVTSSTSETEVIKAIDLCLQSMVKVKDTAPRTTAQKAEAVDVCRRHRPRRRRRRKGDKSSNTAESIRQLSRVDDDLLDLSC